MLDFNFFLQNCKISRLDKFNHCITILSYKQLKDIIFVLRVYTRNNIYLLKNISKYIETPFHTEFHVLQTWKITMEACDESLDIKTNFL